jgi:hypothetical protein
MMTSNDHVSTDADVKAADGEDGIVVSCLSFSPLVRVCDAVLGLLGCWSSALQTCMEGKRGKEQDLLEGFSSILLEGTNGNLQKRRCCC